MSKTHVWREVPYRSIPAGLPPQELQRCGHTATAVDSSIFVIGGRRGSSTYLNDCICLDPSARGGPAWRRPATVLPMSPRNHHTAMLVGRSVWIVGGATREHCADALWRLDVDTMVATQQYVHGDETLLIRAGHAADVHPLDPRAIILFGGYRAAGQYVNDLLVLHTDTCLLEVVSPCGGVVPRARVFHTFTTIPEIQRCILVGGKVHHDSTPTSSSTLMAYDVASRQWSNLSPASTPTSAAVGAATAFECGNMTPDRRSSHRACAYAGRLVLFGGISLDCKDDGTSAVRLNTLRTLTFSPAADRGGGANKVVTAEWSAVDEPPRDSGAHTPGRSAHAACMIGNRLYVLLGYLGVDPKRGSSCYSHDCWTLDLERHVGRGSGGADKASSTTLAQLVSGRHAEHQEAAQHAAVSHGVTSFAAAVATAAVAGAQAPSPPAALRRQGGGRSGRQTTITAAVAAAAISPAQGTATAVGKDGGWRVAKRPHIATTTAAEVVTPSPAVPPDVRGAKRQLAGRPAGAATTATAAGGMRVTHAAAAAARWNQSMRRGLPLDADDDEDDEDVLIVDKEQAAGADNMYMGSAAFVGSAAIGRGGSVRFADVAALQGDDGGLAEARAQVARLEAELEYERSMRSEAQAAERKAAAAAEALKTELQRSTSENAAARDRAAGLQADLQRVQHSLSEATDVVAAARRDVERLQLEASRLQRQVDEAAALRKQYEATNQRLSAELEAAVAAAAAAADREAAGRRAAEATATKAAADLQATTDRLTAELISVRQQADQAGAAASEQLAEARRAAAEYRRLHEEKVQALEQHRAHSTTELRTARDRACEAEAHGQRLASDLGDARSRVSALEQRAATAEADLQVARGEAAGLRGALGACAAAGGTLEAGQRDMTNLLQCLQASCSSSQAALQALQRATAAATAPLTTTTTTTLPLGADGTERREGSAGA